MAIGIIPARYASSRFPGKPLAKIAGITLLERTYMNAKRCPLFSQLVIATDDQRIYDHALEIGAEVVFTSKECPTGTDRMVEAAEQIGVHDDEIVVNVQGDVPLIELEALSKVIVALEDSPADVMATAAVPIRTEEEAMNPSVVKVVFDRQGRALYFSRGLIPHRKFDPKIAYYHHLGIYAFRFSFARRYAELPLTPLQLAEDLEQLKVLEFGYPIRIVVVESQSFGVDTPQDVIKMEQHLCRLNTSS